MSIDCMNNIKSSLYTLLWCHTKPFCTKCLCKTTVYSFDVLDLFITSDLDLIGHRGGIRGYVPEHTIASYTIGIQTGSLYIEPDLVMSKDGVLVCLHDTYLDDVTDVDDHPEFADRKTGNMTCLSNTILKLLKT